MRQLRISFIIGLLLASCSKDEPGIVTFPEDYPHKWQLVSAQTGLSNTSVSGNQLPYFEEYVFNGDNTFTKTRVLDDNSIVATGSFSVERNNDSVFLTLSFDDESVIIDNCSNDLAERLLLTSIKTFSNNILACDYGRMDYSRVD